MSATIIEAIQMPAGVMPPADAVYEVSATPFQATAVGMLFIDTSMKLHKAKELAEADVDNAVEKYGREAVDTTMEFLSLYGDSAALMLGTEAVARLAAPPSRLTLADLCILASVCQIGVQLMPNSDDWAEFVASWLRGVRQQIIDDHAVRSEVHE